MGPEWKFAAALLAATFAVTPLPAVASELGCEKQIEFDETQMACYRQGPELPVPPIKLAPETMRRLRYAELSVRHRLTGLASYYSSFFDGRLTANGEVYRNKRMSAAHLTLPLGTVVEVTARATGRKVRLRINDRGPYTGPFVIDLSQAAARALGVDEAEDRHVDIAVVGLPGDDPLPEHGDAPDEVTATAVR